METTNNVISNLEALNQKMRIVSIDNESIIKEVDAKQELSAENLLHYLSLRSEDIRSLQDELHVLGLSSLASSESHIHSQILAILQVLGQQNAADNRAKCDYIQGKKIIAERCVQLFGSKSDPLIPYIMVTFDTDFAENNHLIKKLLKSGMNVARINCAHDDQETWTKMITLLRNSSDELQLPCKIYMDLAGPKMRTVLLGKGKKDGKVMLHEGEFISFAESDADFDPLTTVIGCSEKGVVSQLKTGQRVMFDDGLIAASVLIVDNNIATLQIQRVSTKKSMLKAEKGMNFPDSHLKLPSLTLQDLEILPFVCKNADLIGYSFVRSAEDIKLLQDEVDKNGGEGSLILKIETPEAVDNLPALLLQGMKRPFFGVMIARGDLAVEIGFERMSEIQEEILWICEAAHVPVIWATQVLETLNKSGIATRSEVTDAAHAAMAECVMVNKGEHIIQVVETLRDILHRSGGHHVKKRYTFRPMRIAKRFFDELGSGFPIKISAG
ncbi:MAG: pyruvate kinase [Bacteroidetes bacterium]|nr:pyruvate kinase [Bacteroidota bacterium]MBL0064533.1 pyruvate kinase [Bacteroidota bacterium]MBL0137539.1 pyruvate kinase [Bacteroidota bacterium]